MQRSFLCSVIVGLIVSFSSFALENEELGVRALSLSGAYRAISSDNSALYFNPAGICFPKRYTISIDYLLDIEQLSHKPGISIVDSKTNVIAVGIDYHIGILPRANNPLQLTHQARLAIAYAPVEVFSFGIEGKYFALPEVGTEKSSNNLTLDAGILLSLPIGLRLGAVGYNLIPTNSSRLPLNVAAGAAFSIGEAIGEQKGISSGVTVAFDWRMKDLLHLNQSKHSLHAGAEVLLFEMVPIRAGYQVILKDDIHSISVGTGFVSDVANADLLFDLGIINSTKKVFGAAVTLFI